MKSLMRKGARAFDLACTTLFFSVLPASAMAADITSVLEKTVKFMQGSIAKSVGLIAIIASGYLCIVSQKLPLTRFGMIIGGLGLVFGASSIYTTLVA